MDHEISQSLIIGYIPTISQPYLTIKIIPIFMTFLAGYLGFATPQKDPNSSFSKVRLTF